MMFDLISHDTNPVKQSIDALLRERETMVQRIGTIPMILSELDSEALAFYDKAAFVKAGERTDGHLRLPDPDPAPAVKALDAQLWSRAIAMTDLREIMPASERQQWDEHIRNHKCPEFTDANVESTLSALWAERGSFVARTVDGIFRGLSRTHVTNSPMGFRQRMILTSVFDEWGNVRHSAYTDRSDHIHDLRKMIHKLIGRDVPTEYDTTKLLGLVRRQGHSGEWYAMDGDSWRLRWYLNGNAHLEVDAEIALELNRILATLHPNAIPSQHRAQAKSTKAKAKARVWDNLLPTWFVALLNALEAKRDDRCIWSTRCELSNVQRRRARDWLEAIGCDEVKYSGDHVSTKWPANPVEVLMQVRTSGFIPDSAAYQFYPTPADVAVEACDVLWREAEFEDVQDEDIESGELRKRRYLEPSAGTGSLIDEWVKEWEGIEDWEIVEYSAARARLLKAKYPDATVLEADFLEMGTLDSFDCILMNPPYSDGRWQAHVAHAVLFLKPGGVLVAILPDSAKLGALQFDGCTVKLHGQHSFAGTSIKVRIVSVKRGT